jgi:hypothetical protein
VDDVNPVRSPATGLVYARRGLVGVLTPQANTTVEPELTLLLPPGVAMLTARLTSDAPSLTQRLRAYFEQLDDFIGRFAQAPLGVVVAAVTGSPYPLGPQAEDALFETASRRRGVPVAGAALALGAALRALGAHRIALVSPYDATLTEAAVAYWQARGFEVVSVRRLESAAGGHHPIYALGGDAAAFGLAAVLSGAAGVTDARLDGPRYRRLRAGGADPGHRHAHLAGAGRHRPCRGLGSGAVVQSGVGMAGARSAARPFAGTVGQQPACLDGR